MTRLLFLPGKDTVVLYDVTIPAEILAEMVLNGQWQPPEPYRSWMTYSPIRLQCATSGSLVIVEVIETSGSLPPAAQEDRLPPLNAREREVLSYLAEGSQTKEIARRMNISSRTVYRMVASLKARLGVRTVAQTVGRAAALGLVRMKKRT